MGYINLLLGIFLIASNFIVGSYGKNIPPWQLAFFRFLIAVIIILPFVLPKLKKSWPIIKTNWVLLLIYGILGITIPGGFAYISLRETTAINGAFIFASSPIFTLIITWLLLHEKLNKWQWLGVIVALFGVLTIIGKGNFHTLLHMKFSMSDLWMLAMAICWAFYTVLVKRWKINLDPQTLLAGTIAMGLLAMLPFCGFELLRHEILVINLRNILIIIYAGIFAGALGYLTYLYGVVQVGPAKAGLLTYLMPVFATIQAYFFLGEKLHSYLLFAIIFIALGIFLTVYFNPQRVE